MQNLQNFTSTRLFEKSSFIHSIFQPNAPKGSLWALSMLPQIPFETLQNLDYISLSQEIFQALDLGVDSALLDAALKSYENFDTPQDPAPVLVKNLCSNLAILELYHGPTRAFKDMALSPFAKLFSSLAKKKNQRYVILVATSGDTGPATLSSFANLENTSVICLYPKGGTSDVQELQMTTQDAPNTKVYAIKGNFDDAQSALKSLIHDKDFHAKLAENGLCLSVANSINFGRIAFQIIYHIWGYFRLLKARNLPYGTPFIPIIPSGNFGNALGAFYAKKMGLPISKILIASNPNNILTDFIHTGIYDISHRKLLLTHSPAMDILKSSNIERVLFSLFGAKRTEELMQQLDTNQKYALSKAELQKLQEDFAAIYCTDENCLKTIKAYSAKQVLIDPHTANALYAYDALQDQFQGAQFLAYSTAQWCKFAPTLAKAIYGQELRDFEAIEKIQRDFGTSAPKEIGNLLQKPVIHSQMLSAHPQEIQEEILKSLKSII